jgi:hypothetical protein
LKHSFGRSPKELKNYGFEIRKETSSRSGNLTC